MTVLLDSPGSNKARRFFRSKILTIPRFDLFLQGALLIVVLLEVNAYLLLRRDAATGYLPKLIEDWVIVGTALAEILFGAGVAWWGRCRRPLALSGWLAASSAAALLALAFPHAAVHDPSVELCGGEPISGYDTRDIVDSLAIPRTVILIITVLLCTLTRLSIWAHGLTYLDDHEPQNGPYFYGILISIRMSLGLNGQNWLLPSSRREDWWEAHLSLSMLALMFSLLFALFPSKMSQYKAVQEKSTDGFLVTISRLVRNKPLMLQIIGLSCLNTALFGFVHYDPYFVQARYHIESMRQDLRSSRSLANIFRSAVIILFVMVFRVRFSVRRDDGVKANTGARVGGVVAIFVAITFAIIAGLRCDVASMAGLESEGYQQLGCSQQCGCESESYGFSPVCDLDAMTTYFSPCHAGCYQHEDLNNFAVFHNCTCVERAVRGGCSLPSCTSTFSFYLLLYALVLAFGAASNLMQGMVFLRAVRQCDKTVAVGASLATVALLSHGPGHLLYMLISHLTCAFKNDGVCIFHHPTLWSLAATSAALSLLSAVVSLIASSIYKRNLISD